MTPWPRFVPFAIVLSTFLLWPAAGGQSQAWAQLGQTPLPQPGASPEASKPEGVAEEAKDDSNRLPTTPVLPPQKSERKRFQLFELDGYYRFRFDWLKNFHMGFREQGMGSSPFPEPLGCVDAATSCDDTIVSSNMRLRLEPVINIDETTSVHLQLDVLDNVVLGSTPETIAGPGSSGFGPLGAFSDRQLGWGPGTGGATDAIRVKRAWAEVETALGQLSVGRQPWHWGLGIYANSGGADPFYGTYDLGANYGDTVDRVMARASIPGTQLQAAVARDWLSTAPVSDHITGFYSAPGAQGWDLEDLDDAIQWVVMISRFDRPALFQENVARGELAINYGGFLAYRTQERDTTTSAEGELQMIQRDLITYTPNVWFKAGKGALSLDVEAVAVFGEIGNVSDIELPALVEGNTLFIDAAIDILSVGGVARLGYKTMEDKLRLGFEVGFASGDQWDGQKPGWTHYRAARPLPIGARDTILDTTINSFMFDPAYSVDLILFRELLGAVKNATYVKPSLAYDITDEIGFDVRGVLSMANKPVATPGNGTFYGLELDGSIGYHKGGLFAGVSYGVLFPLGALDHPENVANQGGPDAGFGFGNGTEDVSNVGSAGTAHTIQTQLVLQF